MSKHQVNAFTLMEVTIAMLVSALVIAITYTSYSIIINYYHSFSAKNDEITTLATLDHLIKRDFDLADTILKDTDGICLKINNKDVNYDFAPGYILRRSLRNDTFKLKVKDLKAAFENLPVDEVQSTPEQNRIDELSFEITYRKESIPYHCYKIYSSENLIQRNTNAVN